MTDIVKQLRGPVSPDDLFVGQWPGEKVEPYDAVRFHAADEIERLRAEMAAKLSALMDTHDDMADDLENMRQALLDIVAVIGRGGTNCGGRVMKIAKFALGGYND